MVSDMARAHITISPRLRNALALILLCCLSASGCSWTDKQGTHYLIAGIGFGLITTTNRPGVDVYDARVLGAVAGPDGGGVGLVGCHRVQLDPAVASNVVVSVKADLGGLSVKNYPITWEGTPNQQVHAEGKANE
jgi:hypothetical protein